MLKQFEWVWDKLASKSRSGKLKKKYNSALLYKDEGNNARTLD